MAIAGVRNPEDLFGRQNLVGAQISEIAVWAVWLEGLIFQDSIDNKGFDSSIPIHKSNFLPNFKIEEQFAGKVVVR